MYILLIYIAAYRQERAIHVASSLAACIRECLADALALEITSPPPPTSSQTCPLPIRLNLAALSGGEDREGERKEGVCGGGHALGGGGRGEVLLDEAVHKLWSKCQMFGGGLGVSAAGGAAGGGEGDTDSASKFSFVALSEAISERHNGRDAEEEGEDADCWQAEEGEDADCWQARGTADLLHHQLRHDSVEECLDYCACHYQWDLRQLAVSLNLGPPPPRA